MRVLFTTQPALGHFHPQVPLARALAAAGHEVAFACAASFCTAVEASGFHAFPSGLDWREEEILAAFPDLDLLPLGPERTAWVWGRIFAGRTAEMMVDDLLVLIADWKPDIIVRETAEYGGCVAAEACGLPHAVVQTIAFRREFDAWVAPPLEHLRIKHGLPEGQALDMLRRYLHLSLVPDAFQNPDVPLPATHVSLRPDVFDASGEESVPDWVNGQLTSPVVYVTLGTVVNRYIPGLFGAIIDGVRDAVGTLIATVGRNVDPASFGLQPPHVHIDQYIPQSAVLPECDAVVTHGGSGTVMAALVHGLPMVVIPIAADQPANAQRIAELNLGRVVGPHERTPEAIGEAVRAILDDSGYRDRVCALRDEVASLPGSDAAVHLLERIANGANR